MIASPRRFRAPERREPLFERIKEGGLEIDGVNVKYRSTFTFSGVIPRLMRPKLDWLAVRGMHPVAGTATVIAPKQSIFSRRASDHNLDQATNGLDSLTTCLAHPFSWTKQHKQRSNKPAGNHQNKADAERARALT